MYTVPLVEILGPPHTKKKPKTGLKGDNMTGLKLIVCRLCAVCAACAFIFMSVFVSFFVTFVPSHS